jgi:RimJ/RimL family protein N-acetyltransferase
METTELLSGTIHTAEGAPIRVRPIESSDWQALQRFHLLLSEESIRRRMFDHLPRLSDAQAHHFCDVDGYDRFALVAINPEHPTELIGVVRFDRIPATTQAEYAAVVSDRWQGHGIGIALTWLLIRAARARQVTTLVALVEPDNRQMLTLLRNLGLPVRTTHEDGYEQINISLSAIDPERSRPPG